MLSCGPPSLCLAGAGLHLHLHTEVFALSPHSHGETRGDVRAPVTAVLPVLLLLPRDHVQAVRLPPPGQVACCCCRKVLLLLLCVCELLSS